MLKFRTVNVGVSRYLSSLFNETSSLVKHNKGEMKFIIEVEGHEPAFLKYKQISSDSLDLWTTVVPRSLEGKGIAKLLANEAFDFARENDYKIKLSCWYLDGYIQRHPRPELQIIK